MLQRLEGGSRQLEVLLAEQAASACRAGRQRAGSWRLWCLGLPSLGKVPLHLLSGGFSVPHTTHPHWYLTLDKNAEGFQALPPQQGPLLPFPA